MGKLTPLWVRKDLIADASCQMGGTVVINSKKFVDIPQVNRYIQA